MAIEELDSNSVQQLCAACGARRIVALGDIDHAAPDGAPYVLVMPPCAACGSVEVLLPPLSPPNNPSPHAAFVATLAGRLRVLDAAPDRP